VAALRIGRHRGAHALALLDAVSLRGLLVCWPVN
jgi:hypothetical protein